MEILNQVCRNVYGSSGDVTAYLRRIWGYDDILHSLDLPRYREGNLTGNFTYNHRGQTHTEERINDWSKRLDHRHHAIDALTIASTRQNIIQRLNTLSAKTAVGMDNITLDKWTVLQPHFSVQDVTQHVADILVSFKSGKKVTTPGKRYVYRGGRRVLVQENLLVPRGALSEESVYGAILSIEEKVPVKKLFGREEDIVKPRIRRIVHDRLVECGEDLKAAEKSLRKRHCSWMRRKQSRSNMRVAIRRNMLSSIHWNRLRLRIRNRLWINILERWSRLVLRNLEEILRRLLLSHCMLMRMKEFRLSR